MNKGKAIMAAMVAVVVLFAAQPRGHAQSGWNQNAACPGWNNPSSFTAGGANINNYSGQGVNVSDPKPCPNPLGGYSAHGANSLGTSYTASQLATVASSGSGCSSTNSNTISPNNQYVIMTNTTGTDPNTNNNLKYVPTQFNTVDTIPGVVPTEISRSIRIGDTYCNGSSYSPNSQGGAVLNYTMRVTGANAMMYIYYAVVAEAPGHGQGGNPTFIIRALKKNASGNWDLISDTLAYYISSTLSSDHTQDCVNMDYVTMAAAGERGWHTTGGSSPYNLGVFYKDWEKVAINLSNYLYDTIRIQVMIYDCLYNAHYAYAYIAGECREMKLSATGCPPGMATDVTTLTAPRDMLNYEWLVSEYGVAEPLSELTSPGGTFSHYTFRSLTSGDGTTDQGSNVYRVQASDFEIRRGPDAGTVSNHQTFKCVMTSALDPAKPYTSELYVNVQNTKPSMVVDTLYSCDGDVKVWNLSEVPGDPTLVVPNLTQWTLFGTPDCIGTPIDQLTGDSIELNFTDSDPKGLLVRTQTTDATCYSEATYAIYPRINPSAGITISNRVLCDADETVIVDTTSTVTRREWYFLPVSATSDTVPLELYGSTDREVVRSFTHPIEPVELHVYNGLYTIYRGDTNWCNAVVRDTVAVFVHPELEVTGDTIVCEGSRTNVTVRAVGVDGCRYEWSLTPGTVTGDLPAGARLAVYPYADKSTYYVKVTSPQGCVAWDSLNAYLVKPHISIMPEDGRICPGTKATLTGSDADHYTWTASPADPSLAGQENQAQIVVSPTVTTTYTMVGHGTNDCDATPLQEKVTIVPLPVPQVNVTPGYIDSDKPKVLLRDASRYSVMSDWQFDDGGTATGREVTHTFEGVIGKDSVSVVLTAYNELNCPVVYPFAIPVNLFTAWFPNAFTPGSQDANAYFSFFNINDYEYFHIYIYNRQGELVYESDDSHFKWDGTRNGEPLPQGTYVYTCRYRKPGSTTLNNRHGSVTLVR